jgi:hypothetical protein
LLSALTSKQKLIGQICGFNKSVVYKSFSDLFYVGECALRDGNKVPLKYICSVFILSGCLMYLVGQKWNICYCNSAITLQSSKKIDQETSSK